MKSVKFLFAAGLLVVSVLGSWGGLGFAGKIAGHYRASVVHRNGPITNDGTCTISCSDGTGGSLITKDAEACAAACAGACGGPCTMN
ncbi:MAG: hypothetical protein M3O15_10530 [Acidobacteriota bacterium]|nr:hypothetical protein [Acidobacteriota bacterium]